eukprot:3281151-Pleurochrysis_carterae.AAC.3
MPALPELDNAQPPFISSKTSSTSEFNDCKKMHKFVDSTQYKHIPMRYALHHHRGVSFRKLIRWKRTLEHFQQQRQYKYEGILPRLPTWPNFATRNYNSFQVRLRNVDALCISYSRPRDV